MDAKQFPRDESQTIVLFSGSRDASPAMLDYTESMVKKAILKNYWIFVGDNPSGVDMRVLEYTEGMMYPHITIWSPSALPGEYHMARSMQKMQGLKVTSHFKREDFYQRDRTMAEFAQKGIFIWNGVSPGTQALHIYMTKELEKETHLINFKSGKPEISSFIPMFA